MLPPACGVDRWDCWHGTDGLSARSPSERAALRLVGTSSPICLPLRVDLFVVCKHGDELINAGLARLRLLGGLDSVTDRIAIELVERFKELAGLWVSL